MAVNRGSSSTAHHLHGHLLLILYIPSGKEGSLEMRLTRIVTLFVDLSLFLVESWSREAAFWMQPWSLRVTAMFWQNSWLMDIPNASCSMIVSSVIGLRSSRCVVIHGSPRNEDPTTCRGRWIMNSMWVHPFFSFCSEVPSLSICSEASTLLS